VIATLEQTLYRSVVDEEFRALLAASPDLFGLGGAGCPGCPEAVESEVHRGLAGTAMADVDFQACKNTCSWGVSVLCDKITG
jgi:hypothetical protein